MLKKFSDEECLYPFAKNGCNGERVTRSAVCTSSAFHSLRPCWMSSLNIL